MTRKESLYVIVKMPRVQNKERILKTSKDKCHAIYKEKPIYKERPLTETLKARRAWAS
jgi:hypothetical protein